MFTLKDGSAISQNCTYIQNPSFPNADTSANAITYTVNKCNDGTVQFFNWLEYVTLMHKLLSADVCFLRLDFENFVLQGTTGTNLAGQDGVCTDTFTVTVHIQ